MSPKQHIVELNGKRYDTTTGKIVSGTHDTKNHKVKKSKSIDGFNKPSNVARKLNHSTPHKTQKSKTLMRKIVPRPMAPVIQSVTTSINKTTELLQSSYNYSSDKLKHAKTIPKSKLIQKFNNNLSDIVRSTKDSIQPSQPLNHRLQAHSTAKTIHSDHINQKIAEADSHNQTKIKKVRRHVRIAKKLKVSPRTLNTGSFIVLAFLFAGFFVYQNLPSINMKLASAKSGIQGSLPKYQPAGFGLNGSIFYKPGQITVGYKSHSDDRNFKITQSASQWDSAGLKDNFVSISYQDFQTVEDRGKTIYIYDSSNATWVDGGIWYRVEGDSKLNSDQLLNLASSL